MSDAKLPVVGDTLAGKYVLKRVLGEGGMGTVFAAEHSRLRQEVALKILNPDMLGVDIVVQRFEREARAAATLRSRHVVRVTDVEQTADGLPYMVMELLEGADLETTREQRKQLPYGEAVDYVVQACAALVEAHEAGIVHRDLKPANLFLAARADETPIVKVLDFGISKFLAEGDAKLTSAGTIMGTALYMSPEQIRGEVELDARSDIWSLGVILYELIGGTPPWEGPPTRVAAGIVAELAPKLSARVALPPDLEALIERMMAKDPAERPQTILDLVDALAPFVPQGTVGAEVAEQLVRRGGRRVVRSSPDLVGLDPAAARAVAMAQTLRQSPERSTMTATSASLVEGRAPRKLGVVVIGAMALAIGIVAAALLLRPPPPRGAALVSSGAAANAAPPEASSLALPPVPGSASAPAPSEGAAAATASVTSTKTPPARSAARPQPGGVSAPPATTAAPPATTAAPPPTTRPADKPNPLFL